MNRMNRLAVLGLALCAVIGLPPLGVTLAGRSAAAYLAFPPRPTFVSHAPFSWPVFLALSLAIAAVVGPFVLRIGRCLLSRATHGERPLSFTPRSFPWWGWAAVAWTGAAWVLAWTRFSWMTPFQGWTFTPLWIGYILVVNAWTCRRGGRSVMIEQPAAFLALFPISAAFWWLFEYLNRFVENWHYGGAGELSAADYFIQASIPFSTVLPAVISTVHLLATVPQVWCGLDRGPAPAIRHASGWAGVALLIAGTGLLALGIWPDLLFPLVWMAPLFVIVSIQTLTGQPTIFAPLRQGDWRRLWTAAMASLVCGLFWELWNWRSLAHWSYAIPFVDRFHLFAMPLLGYAGYVPFGLECLVVADLVLHGGRDRPSSAAT